MTEETTTGKTSRYGDLPTTFEELYKAFFLNHPDLAPRAYAGVLGIAQAVAHKNGDTKLMELYHSFSQDDQVTPDEMLLLVWESFAVMYRDGTWTKTQQPFSFLQPQP